MLKMNFPLRGFNIENTENMENLLVFYMIKTIKNGGFYCKLLYVGLLLRVGFLIFFF